MVWDMDLEFRRSQREQFRLSVPKGYMVGHVAGDNVRGWEVHQANKDQALDVTLLKAAKDHEQFTLHLWRGGAVGQGELGEFDMPLVTAAGAAQAAGQITIRRSPLMDVRTVAQSGRRRGPTWTRRPLRRVAGLVMKARWESDHIRHIVLPLCRFGCGWRPPR